MTPHLNLQEWFGQIDIYLFDQLLKGRFDPRMRVLDAGCGGGRNLVYFLRCGYDVSGVDLSTEAVTHVRALASGLAPDLPADNFRVEPVEAMSFAAAAFDVVISSAVLHFARDDEHWQAMMGEMWRVLKPGGIFFARLASSVGVEEQIERLEGRRYRLPDGSDRFLVDDRMLLAAADSLGGELIEPLKTVVVRGLRSMSTWCLRKS
ncbi:MAG TPA: class I SAM-dependent methyltransferase [Pyrinomonadaceae bacterium]|jgi:SAM-dependent methyltransferase|nr:class I SAM-dependent methyltransferase [Pyrinomonadaceae bacterium]